MLREWCIPGISQLLERADYPIGYSLFWYCSTCGRQWAFAKVDGEPWIGIGSCCQRCKGSKYSMPGSLETVRLAGWQVPLEVLNYQLKIELHFLNHPDHPYNEKELVE